MKKNFTSLLLTLLSTACFSQNILNDSLGLKIQQKLQEVKEKYKVPGIVLVMVGDQEIIYSHAVGYSNLEEKIPATIDTKYGIASVTKTFTATALMQLAGRGTLSLHDDVRKYVPEYNAITQSGDVAQTTLFQLASHTAGLPRNAQADLAMSTAMNRWFLNGGKGEFTWFPPNEKILESIRYLRLDHPPYQYMWYSDRHYSNLGYTILGIALERASNTPFETYVAENICKPLGMNNTGFINPGLEAELAPAYWMNPQTKNLVKAPFCQWNSAMYAGGMYSTGRDLARYISFQFQSNTGDTVLDETSREMMRTLKIGWKPDYPFVLHRGHWPTGIQSCVYFHPRLKVGWAILTNTSDIDMNGLNEFMKNIVGSNFKSNYTIDLKEYTGSYELEGGMSSIEISLKDGKLYSNYLNDLLPDNPMIPDGNNRFIVKGDFDHIIDYDFQTDPTGKVKMVTMGQLSWYKKLPLNATSDK